MNTSYAIIYSSISPFGNERINLGLLLFQASGKLMFKVSWDKLAIIKQFISKEAFQLLKVQLKSMESYFDTHTKNTLQFEKASINFAHYLANYSNNLVSLTTPKHIDIDMSEKVFHKLFEQYVFKLDAGKKAPKTSTLVAVKKAFIPKVDKRMNIDFQLNAATFDFMVFNLQVDMIGRNDRPVLTQFVDFIHSPETIKHKVNDYVSIIKPLELKEGGAGKFFLVAQEPDRSMDKQKRIWDHLKESPLVKNAIVEIVSPNELESIEEYLEKHDVQPFVDEQRL